MSDDKFWVEELYDAPKTLTLPTELVNLVHTLVMHQACDMAVPLSAYEDLVNQLDALRLAATPPPQGGFFAEDPNDYEEGTSEVCTNHYACANCPEDWSIEATCEHDDDCPKCGTSMTPYFSDYYDDPEPRGKEITAAYNALAHRTPNECLWLSWVITDPKDQPLFNYTGRTEAEAWNHLLAEERPYFDRESARRALMATGFSCSQWSQAAIQQHLQNPRKPFHEPTKP